MFTPQTAVFMFLGVVLAGLIIWTFRKSGRLDDADKTYDRLKFEADMLTGKLRFADDCVHDLRKQVTMKVAEIAMERDANKTLAAGILLKNDALAKLLAENDSLKFDYQVVKAENERFLTDLTKAVTKIPKHDPTTGRFVKKVF